jgi:hypothetical protein
MTLMRIIALQNDAQDFNMRFNMPDCFLND